MIRDVLNLLEPNMEETDKDKLIVAVKQAKTFTGIYNPVTKEIVYPFAKEGTIIGNSIMYFYVDGDNFYLYSSDACYNKKYLYPVINITQCHALSEERDEMFQNDSLSRQRLISVNATAKLFFELLIHHCGFYDVGSNENWRLHEGIKQLLGGSFEDKRYANLFGWQNPKERFGNNRSLNLTEFIEKTNELKASAIHVDGGPFGFHRMAVEMVEFVDYYENSVKEVGHEFRPYAAQGSSYAIRDIFVEHPWDESKRLLTKFQDGLTDQIEYLHGGLSLKLSAVRLNGYPEEFGPDGKLISDFSFSRALTTEDGSKTPYENAELSVVSLSDKLHIAHHKSGCFIVSPFTETETTYLSISGNIIEIQPDESYFINGAYRAYKKARNLYAINEHQPEPFLGDGNMITDASTQSKYLRPSGHIDVNTMRYHFNLLPTPWLNGLEDKERGVCFHTPLSIQHIREESDGLLDEMFKGNLNVAGIIAGNEETFIPTRFHSSNGKMMDAYIPHAPHIFSPFGEVPIKHAFSSYGEFRLPYLFNYGTRENRDIGFGYEGKFYLSSSNTDIDKVTPYRTEEGEVKFTLDSLVDRNTSKITYRVNKDISLFEWSRFLHNEYDISKYHTLLGNNVKLDNPVNVLELDYKLERSFDHYRGNDVNGFATLPGGRNSDYRANSNIKIETMLNGPVRPMPHLRSKLFVDNQRKLNPNNLWINSNFWQSGSTFETSYTKPTIDDYSLYISDSSSLFPNWTPVKTDKKAVARHAGVYTRDPGWDDDHRYNRLEGGLMSLESGAGTAEDVLEGGGRYMREWQNPVVLSRPDIFYKYFLPLLDTGSHPEVRVIYPEGNCVIEIVAHDNGLPTRWKFGYSSRTFYPFFFVCSNKFLYTIEVTSTKEGFIEIDANNRSETSMDTVRVFNKDGVTPAEFVISDENEFVSTNFHRLVFNGLDNGLLWNFRDYGEEYYVRNGNFVTPRLYEWGKDLFTMKDLSSALKGDKQPINNTYQMIGGPRDISRRIRYTPTVISGKSLGLQTTRYSHALNKYIQILDDAIFDEYPVEFVIPNGNDQYVWNDRVDVNLTHYYGDRKKTARYTYMKSGNLGNRGKMSDIFNGNSDISTENKLTVCSNRTNIYDCGGTYSLRNK